MLLSLKIVVKSEKENRKDCMNYGVGEKRREVKKHKEWSCDVLQLDVLFLNHPGTYEKNVLNLIIFKLTKIEKTYF